MRIFIRTSKWATWARRLGSLCEPLTVIPVLLHRERFITSDVFMVVAEAAALLSLLTLLISLIGLVRLWFSGDQGWGRAFSGLFLSLLCLVPVAWFAFLALRHEPNTDISTVPRGELPLVFDPEMLAMPAPRTLTPEQVELAYPNVKTRTYPLDAVQTFDLVHRMVEARGWTIRLDRPPAGPTGTGQINAQEVTLAGWREEIVLRVASAGEGTNVDMRSASLNAVHDFGSNGSRIEEFLTALDNEVTVILRDNPNVTVPVEVEPEVSPESAGEPATAG